MTRTVMFLTAHRMGSRSRAWAGTLAIGGLLFAMALTLAGCAKPEAIAAVPPTATVYAPPPTDSPPPPAEPTPAALSFPLAPPPREAVEQPTDQTCVDCHTNEETLKAVAMVVEQEEESLSEGEG